MMRAVDGARLGVLAGALVLPMLLSPLAASAASKPSPESKMAKQLKVLKQQTAALAATFSGLQAKAAALEVRGPTASPLSGPAGGDFVGSYPDPELHAGTIVGDDIADGAISESHLAPETLSGSHVADGSIGSAEIENNSIGQAELSPASVGAPQLVDVVVEDRPAPAGVLAFGGKFVGACGVGMQVIGAGFEMRPPPARDSIFVTKSVPSEEDPRKWELGIQIDRSFPVDELQLKLICLEEQ